MARYTVQFPSDREVGSEERRRVKRFPGLVVLDETKQMLLVEASSETAAALQAELPDWVVIAEKLYRMPDARKRIKRPAPQVDPEA